MVNPEVIHSLLSNLRRYLERLRLLAAASPEEFLADFTKVESAKYLLQVSIGCCLDIAQHIVADEGYGTPSSYYETFVLLSEHGVLPSDFLPVLRNMVSFRNRLVHLYWEVDDRVVYQILQENLGDFEKYIGYIVNFMQREVTQ